MYFTSPEMPSICESLDLVSLGPWRLRSTSMLVGRLKMSLTGLRSKGQDLKRPTSMQLLQRDIQHASLMLKLM
jgi:hypothetical protein